MKVALDARALTWSTQRGIARYQFNLANELIKLGVKVFLIVEKSNFFISPPEKAEVFEVPIFFKKTIGPLIWSQLTLLKKLKQLPIDLYHNTDNDRLPFFCSVPSVITIHDISPFVFPQFSYNFWPLVRKIIYKTNLLINKYSKAEIITVSRATRNDLIRYLKINPARINVVYNGFNPPEIPKEYDIKKTISKFSLRSPYFIYLGGIEPRKNLLFLVQAFNKYLKETQAREKLVIVGETGKYIEAVNCYRQIQDYLNSTAGKNLKGEIIFTGEITEKEKGVLLKKSIALVYPSLYEGFGFPPLEAASLGVPVISSPTSGILEVAGEFALLASPYKIGELATAFKKIKNKNIRKKLISLGLKKIKEYSWAKTAKETLLVYEKALRKLSKSAVTKQELLSAAP